MNAPALLTTEGIRAAEGEAAELDVVDGAVEMVLLLPTTVEMERTLRRLVGEVVKDEARGIDRTAAASA